MSSGQYPGGYGGAPGAYENGIAPQNTLGDALGGAIGGPEGAILGAATDIAAELIPGGSAISKLAKAFI